MVEMAKALYATSKSIFVSSGVPKMAKTGARSGAENSHPVGSVLIDSFQTKARENQRGRIREVFRAVLCGQQCRKP